METSHASSPAADETPMWEPEIAPDGVDVSLIRSMLKLTPTERLERMQDFLEGVLALRKGRVRP